MGCGSSKGVRSSVLNTSSDHNTKRETEKRLSAIAKEKNTLQSKALQMMHSSHDDMSGFDSMKAINQCVSDEQSNQIKQTKKMKRKEAKLLAEAENKWMIFNNTDIFDESEMIELARFMELLLNKIPEIQSQDSSKLTESSTTVHVSPEDGRLRSMSMMNLNEYNIDEDGIILCKDGITSTLETFVANHSNHVDEPVISLPTKNTPKKDSFRALKYDHSENNTIDVKRENSVDRLFRLDKVALEQLYKPEKRASLSPVESPSHSNNITVNSSNFTSSNNNDTKTFVFENSDDYDLPTGFITMAIVNEIIEVYRNNRRLSVKSIHKLQRLSYRRLVKLPNINYVTINSNIKLTVVGDLHGKELMPYFRNLAAYKRRQLYDLLHILDESGLPSENHKYVFNGDFVDRGSYGVEIVCILLALFLASPPGFVNFNRGNHEDYAICSAYSFQQECLQKYDEITFGMFVEIFNYLPLFTIINNDIFIVHGGLFHATDVRINELEFIKRHEFSLLDLSNSFISDDDNEVNEPLTAISRTNYADFLKQLQRDALWSDPKNNPGLDFSPRGAGVSFGPDVALQFLQNNNLKFIIRSHECVRSGFDKPYSSGNDSNNMLISPAISSSTSNEDDLVTYDNILCTIFSASNYSNSGNTAAYIVITTNEHMFHRLIVKNMINKINSSNLIYSIHYYYNTNENDSQPEEVDANTLEISLDNDADDDTVIDYDQIKSNNDNASQLINKSKEELSSITDASTNPSSNHAKSFSLFSFILKKKTILLDNFRIIDKNSSKFISNEIFIDLFNHILKIHLNWLSLLILIYINRTYILQEYNKQFHFTSSDDNQTHLIDTSNFITIETTDDTTNILIQYEKFLEFLDIINYINTSLILSIDKDIDINENDEDGKNKFLPIKNENSSFSIDISKKLLIEKLNLNIINLLKNEIITIDNLFFHLLYDQSYSLELVFQYFDIDDNGVITYEEFTKQCQKINELMNKYDYENLYNLLDIKETDEIDINIFFEMYRISKEFYSNTYPSSSLVKNISVDDFHIDTSIVTNDDEIEEEDIMISYVTPHMKTNRLSLKLNDNVDSDLTSSLKRLPSPTHHGSTSILASPMIELNGKIINVDGPINRQISKGNNANSTFAFD